MHLALYQPDIPQNTGAMLRMAACFGLAVDVIEPTGFVFGEARMRRAGMDYWNRVEIRRFADWPAFAADRRDAGARLILMTTRGDRIYTDFTFQAGDTIVMGRESAGVPDDIHAACDARLRVPMAVGTRSLNVAQTAAIAVAEGLRQTNGFPGGSPVSMNGTT
jgi:tRNA (cytidine/uridine-2'-O-)-methyltransferase